MKIGVVAFGHLNFKDCCQKSGLQYSDCVHIRAPSQVMDCDVIHLHDTAPDKLRDLALVKSVAAIEGLKVALFYDKLYVEDPGGKGPMAYDPINFRRQRHELAHKYNVIGADNGLKVCLAVIAKYQEK